MDNNNGNDDSRNKDSDFIERLFKSFFNRVPISQQHIRDYLDALGRIGNSSLRNFLQNYRSSLTGLFQNAFRQSKKSSPSDVKTELENEEKFSAPPDAIPEKSPKSKLNEQPKPEKTIENESSGLSSDGLTLLDDYESSPLERAIKDESLLELTSEPYLSDLDLARPDDYSKLPLGDELTELFLELDDSDDRPLLDFGSDAGLSLTDNVSSATPPESSTAEPNGDEGLTLLDGGGKPDFQKNYTEEQLARLRDEIAAANSSLDKNRKLAKDEWAAARNRTGARVVNFDPGKGKELYEHNGEWFIKDSQTNKSLGRASRAYFPDELTPLGDENQSYVVKLPDGRKFRIVVPQDVSINDIFYTEKNGKVEWRRVSTEAKKSKKEYGATASVFSVPYDEATKGGAIFPPDSDTDLIGDDFLAGASKPEVPRVEPQIDNGLSRENTSNISARDRTPKPDLTNADFENFVDGLMDDEREKTIRDNVVEYEDVSSPFFALSDSSLKDRFGDKKTSYERGAAPISRRDPQNFRNRVRADGTVVVWDEGLVENDIDPNTVKVNSLGWGGRVEFDLTKNAPFGEYGNIRPNRANKDELKKMGDLALVEQAIGARRLATPDYLIDLVRRFTGYRPNRTWVSPMVAEFNGYDDRDKSKQKSYQYASTIYTLQDMMEGGVDALITELAENDANLNLQMENGAAKLGQALDSLFALSPTGALGFSKMFGAIKKPQKFNKKASQAEIKNKRSKFNQSIRELEQGIEEHERTFANIDEQISAIEQETGITDEEKAKRIEELQFERTAREPLYKIDKQMLKMAKEGIRPETTYQAQARKVFEMAPSYVKELAGAISEDGKSIDPTKTPSPEVLKLVGKSSAEITKNFAKTSSAAMTVASALGRIGGAIGGFVTAVSVGSKLAKTFIKLNKAVETVINEQATFSSLTAVTARWFAGREFLRTAKEAQFLESSRADLAASWSDVKDAWQPVILEFKKIANIFLAAVNDFVKGTGKVVNAVVNQDNIVDLWVQVNAMDTKTRKYIKDNPEFQQFLVREKLNARDLIDIYDKAYGVNSHHTIDYFLKDFDKEKRDAFLYLHTNRESVRKLDYGKDFPLFTKYSVPYKARKDAQDQINVYRESREAASRLSITPEDVVWYRERKGENDPYNLRNAYKDVIALSKDKEALLELASLKKTSQDDYERLYRKTLWRGSVLARSVADENINNANYDVNKTIKEGAEEYRFTPTNEELKEIYKDALSYQGYVRQDTEARKRGARSVWDNTGRGFADEEANFRVFQHHFGDFSTRLNPDIEKGRPDAANWRSILKELQSANLIKLQQLEQMGKVDKSLVDILEAERKIAQNTEGDMTAGGEDPITSWLGEGEKEIRGKGKKEWEGNFQKPWGWNDDGEKPNYGRWAQKPEVHRMGLDGEWR